MSYAMPPRSRLRTLVGASIGLVTVLALGAAVPLPANAQLSTHEGHVIPGAYIVTLRDVGSPAEVANDHARRYGVQIEQLYRHAVQGYAARMTESAAVRLASDPRVAWVESDRLLTASGQLVPTGLERVDGELSSAAAGDGAGSVNVDVAVLDTGIDLDHPDLNVMAAKNCLGGSAPDDGNGHGTHVAGTIGAKDNADGVVGVAPGARLHAVKVLDDSGSGSWSSVLCGIDWVTANAATIETANMSLSGTGTEPGRNGCSTGDALHDGICRSVAAGVTYVVAAGNDRVNAAKRIPAAYDEVITVSALADFDGQRGGQAVPTCQDDQDDTFADFSNYGSDIDLIAPGVCITSTWPGAGLHTISGTSMAAPHVAGAAALYVAGKTSRPAPEDVKQALRRAGNTNWSNRDDRDRTKEILVNVDNL